MVSIYFWGDSWASPTKRDIKEATYQGHSYNLLKDKGYIMTNFAEDGVGNLYSIQACQNYDAPDYLFWFHTDMLRDHSVLQQNYLLDDSLHKIANIVYSRASQILNQWQHTKLIIIEGQSPVIEPEFSKYISPYILKNWRYELYNEFGRALPKCYCLSSIDMINSEKIIDSTENKMKELKLIDNHYIEMSMNKLFPDNGHPNDACHKNLVDWFEKKERAMSKHRP